jgi:AMP phosphorylase
MKLKVKLWRWSAGIPVAILNKKTADKMGVHTKDRISIKKLKRNAREISTVVDTIGILVKKNEIAISCEIRDILDLREGQMVDVNLAESSRSLTFIKEKLDGKKLSKEKIFEIIKDVVDNDLSEAEIALFVASMHIKGMDFNEITNLIKAILDSGNKLNLKRKLIADKHSIGGVAGNRTTPIVVSICAAAGLTIPKTSSRAITSAAGTADVIETIAKINFNMKELKKIIQKTKGCMVWGGGLGMVPADSKIIRIEKQLKIDPKAQLLASIMSKKLAVGSNYILIDIPYGKGAKVNKNKALELKGDFERLGKYFKKKLEVVLTDGSQPIGNGVGPALELIDVKKVLDPEQTGPLDLEEKSIFLSAKLLEMTGKAKKGEGELISRKLLTSGKAFEKFKQIIKAQSGNINKIKLAKLSHNIVAKKSFKIKSIDNKKINYLARVAGCPLDKSAGLYLHYKVGDKVAKGEKLITIYAESKARLGEAVKFYKENKVII